MSASAPKTAWLSSKLKQFALDEEIYLNYIESVLDGEEDRCEKISALEAILGEVLVSVMLCYVWDYRSRNVRTLLLLIDFIFPIRLQSENEAKIQCIEIINMYDTQDVNDPVEVKKAAEDTEEILVKMLENNIRTVVPNKTSRQDSDEVNSDLMKIRKNILSQYAQVR